MEAPKKKLNIRCYRSFEEQAEDEARMAALRMHEERLQDTVQLISRVYGVPLNAKMIPILRFGTER